MIGSRILHGRLLDRMAAVNGTGKPGRPVGVVLWTSDITKLKRSLDPYDYKQSLHRTMTSKDQHELLVGIEIMPMIANCGAK